MFRTTQKEVLGIPVTDLRIGSVAPLRVDSPTRGYRGAVTAEATLPPIIRITPKSVRDVSAHKADEARTG